MLQNYNKLVDRIARASGLTLDEVDRKVEAKRAKLSGLISKEGSAQIVASELGVNFEKEKMKISELVSGMKKISLVGKIISEPLIREFSKNGRDGKVASMTLADDTNNLRLVLWDTNHISLFENYKITKDDIVEISNGSVRNDEIHLGSFSDIKKSKETFDFIVTEKKLPSSLISELSNGTNVKLRAFIVQMFEPKFFEVCPECGKKPFNNECITHGSVIPEKRALISLGLDDGSENMRAVMFSEVIEEIGISKEELNNPELFAKRKREFLGKEAVFFVSVRNNLMFNNMEMLINKVEDVNIDQLIVSLKNKDAI